MSSPSYPSNRPESPRSSPPCSQQRLSLDGHGERVGQGATTPSNTSSLISSVGSPSDRTSETNLDSPCSRDLNATHPLLLTLPPDLLESLTQTISILWQIRAVGGPANYHRLAHLDRFFQQEPTRIELPLSHTAYDLLLRFLRLEDLPSVSSADKSGKEGKIQGRGWYRNTEVLRSAAASIVWASKHARVPGGQDQHLDLDSEGTSSNSGLSPQASLAKLGRWVLDKLRLEYDYDDSIFVVRMPTFFHEKSSQDIAECLLAYIGRAVGDNNIDDVRFSARSLPLTLDAEGNQNDEAGDGGDLVEEEGNIKGTGDNELAPVDVIRRENQYHPDAGIFEKASLQPGLILELGFSNPTHRRRAKKYIRGGNGHIRCVLLLNIDYRPRSERLNRTLPPPRILLTAFRIDSNADSWGVKQFMTDWDLRAASDENRQLNLPGDLISEHVDSNVHVSIPLRALVEKVDNAMMLQQEVDRLAQGISPAQPSSSDIRGKRKRTATPDSIEDAEGSFHPDDGNSDGSNSQSSHTVAVRSDPVKRRKGGKLYGNG